MRPDVGARAPQVCDWLQGLETFPSLEPGSWRLLNSYPRTTLEPGSTVADVAQGAKQVAVFVEAL